MLKYSKKNSFYFRLYRLLPVLFLLYFSTAIYAQQEVLLTIDNKAYTIDDFLFYYNKNNDQPLSNNLDSLHEKLNEFIDIKLKVIDAQKQGLDKSPEFIFEFEKFKEQLADRFLIDQEVFNKLLNQAYQRIKNEVRVNHILLRVSSCALPEDTLIAYKKAMNIRKRLAESESFEHVAMEVSDDPSAAFNGGNLWYVSAFKTAYKLENYLYKAVKDTFSYPLHTQNGYHIVQVTDYRKNPGMMKVAHILIALPFDAGKEQINRAKRKADEVYAKLKSGEKFEDLLLKYSDDVGVQQNGILPWFGTGEMDRDFENACIHLRKGEISKPVRTKYGWHIIKKIDQQDVPDFSEIKDQIANKIRQNDRYEICKAGIIEQCKKECGFEEKFDTLFFYNMIDSSLIFQGKWQAPSMIMRHEVLFKIGDKEYNKQNFIDFLVKNQHEMYPVSLKKYIAKQYERFKNRKILDWAYLKLEKSNKEYRHILDAFRDAILVSLYQNNEVYSKAQTDTNALKKYYALHSDDYNKYSADISVFSYAKDMNLKKMKKYFAKYKKQHIKDELLAKVISKSAKSELRFVKRYTAEEGSDEIFDFVMNEFYLGKISSKQKLLIRHEKNMVIYLNSEIKKNISPWQKYRDELETEYGNNIEQTNLQTLRKKHTVKIIEETLKSLTY